MQHRTDKAAILLVFCLVGAAAGAAEKDLGLQLAENPPMQAIFRTPPPPLIPQEFDVREGFRLIETLEEFRAAIKRDGQKIRMKPGVYRAEKVDPAMEVPLGHATRDEDGKMPMNRQEHIFAVNGSDNHFDLRGVVFETPVSVQSRLTGRAHVADTWHVNGSNNVFEGGYFRNVVDRPYPEYRVTENEFEVCGDGNTFRDCTFVIKGSVPYGYTDYYGKGGPNFGRLNKHSFMSISHANNTSLIGCAVYMQSFGHCVHFHTVDGVLIKDCLLSGTLRPTADIYKETAGRAVEYDFHVMYRGRRPIPREEMIPLTEDGVRAYEEVKNITVVDTTVERLRGCFQLLCVGNVTLENVTVREAGDFGYDLSSGSMGKVVMKNCRGDIAYNPLFNLTRGDVPKDAFYEVTVLSPAAGVEPTPRTGLGILCGDGCTFILRDGTTRPVPQEYYHVHCGGRKGMVDCTLTNYTTAKVILDERVRNCTIRSVGSVEDNGDGNTIVRMGPEAAAGRMERIQAAGDGRGFVLADGVTRFTPWGFNYDHDADGRLIEDYWDRDWPVVEADFAEMKRLGGNVIRVHLQFGRFLSAPAEPNERALGRLAEVLSLAERTGLYLDITGLGCYHKEDVPDWYDTLSEEGRWDAQERFWEAIARTCAESPAVFCYDLMNEPVLPSAETETEWLLGDFGGKHFVQRISLDLAGRSREEVAREWVRKLTAAIRRHDPQRPITVGVIPWALVFPGARPLFYSPEVAEELDFVSVHFYPESEQIERALEALRAYDVGKPLVIEEMFPLKCSVDEMREFILASRDVADGWISFYWGKRPQEYTADDGIAAALTRKWLRAFQSLGSEILHDK